MQMYDLIVKAKRGEPLSREEIRYFVRGYTEGSIPDCQAAAWAMAVCLRGMSDREAAILTDEMMHSGETVDLSCFGSLSVDKHSTGGVGDKTTLIVAPLVAALGGKVAKMSGRALGHTGGTIDKLECIPGYRSTLSPEQFRGQVDRIGVAVIGQSAVLAPADKKLYALRDRTATVDSVPLIASSIMSKKLAAGTHSIVLDVKVGSGAFMKTPEDARHLARTMVEIGRACGRRVTAVLTDMDAPLGSAVGNIPEVGEAAALLRGDLPETAASARLREVCLTLAAEMLSLCLDIPVAYAREKADAALRDGSALRRAVAWIEAQGGDSRALTHPDFLVPPDARSIPIPADRAGYLMSVDSEEIGRIAALLETDPAGKRRYGGIELCAAPGDRIAQGAPLCRLLAAADTPPEVTAEAQASAARAFSVGDAAGKSSPLILDIFR